MNILPIFETIEYFTVIYNLKMIKIKSKSREFK